jgi:hypothetical protein
MRGFYSVALLRCCLPERMLVAGLVALVAVAAAAPTPRVAYTLVLNDTALDQTAPYDIQILTIHLQVGGYPST